MQEPGATSPSPVGGRSRPAGSSVTVNTVNLAALLTLGMAMGSFGGPTLGVLAPFLVEEFGLSEREIGWLSMTYGIVGMLVSVRAGHLVDRIGGIRALAILFVVAMAGVVTYAAALSYWVLFIGSLLVGVSTALSNPATNRVLYDSAAIRARGAVLGVKQSGLLAGMVLCGLVVPFVAQWLGWRGGLLFLLFAPLLGLLLVAWASRARISGGDPEVAGTESGGSEDGSEATDSEATDPGQEPRRRLRTMPLWGAAMTMGIALSSVITFTPLFAVNADLVPSTHAGLVTVLLGVTGGVSRVLLGHFFDRRSQHDTALMVGLALAGAGGILLLYAASASSWPWLLWAGVVVVGMTAMAWNVVAVMGIMKRGKGNVGRVSGHFMSGFLAGFVVGPALFGWIVSTAAGWSAAWGATALALLCSGTLSYFTQPHGREMEEPGRLTA